MSRESIPHDKVAAAMSPSCRSSTVTDGLAALETAVIQLQLSDDTPGARVLRAQWEASEVVERELTGVGFYTTFSIPTSLPAVTDPLLKSMGDVQAEIEGLAHGAGFVLWLEEGRLKCLEGYSYQEPWPDALRGFRVSRSIIHERSPATPFGWIRRLVEKIGF
jgi:hypothetical protein